MTTRTLTVNLFGRETPITAEYLNTTASTLALLTCLPDLDQADTDALQRACALIHRVSQ